MEVNKEELRRLAEAATPGPWFIGGTGDGVIWHEHERQAGCAGVVARAISGSEEISKGMPRKENSEFIAAANPAAILSLLDEHDAREKKARETSLLWLEENAQLRAENERLRKDAERYRWLRQRAGVDFICGDFLAYVNTEKMTEVDLETTDASIDAAIAKEAIDNS